MNCYLSCQKLSKLSKTRFTTTKETALAPFNLAHPVGLYLYIVWEYGVNVCLNRFRLTSLVIINGLRYVDIAACIVSFIYFPHSQHHQINSPKLVASVPGSIVKRPLSHGSS